LIETPVAWTLVSGRPPGSTPDWPGSEERAPVTTSEHPADGPSEGARALALARELAPIFAERAAAHDERGRFPEADFADLRASGLFGLMVPRRLGGFGATFAEYARVAAELARGAGSTALIFNMHASVTGALAQTPDDLVRLLGAPESSFEARDKALAAAAGGALYGVAMSERGSGSRLSQTSTAYRRTGNGYRITGSKAFVSGSGHVDAYLVTAREADAEDPQVSYFLVPAGDGIRVEETWDSLGMRATGSHDVHFDVEVGPDALLGGVEGLTLMIAEAMPQWLVASYAAVYAGVARAAVDAAADHLNARRLTHLPSARARLGRADAAAAAAQLAVAETAARIDRAPGEPETNRWVWRAKLIAGDTAVQVASSLLEAAGASATRRGHPLERLYRDARCGALQPATSDVCADWLGVAALGEDPDHDAEVPRW
jgi:alkylation response protein AidB-like acyl-CoA dehydrogenase